MIALIGDIHGFWDSLFSTVKRCGLKDCTLICVGDLGIGFAERQQNEPFRYLNQFFIDKNIDFLSIRGNHDDPSYWDGSINLSNFKLIPDNTLMELEGEKWFFVGGAISIDRRFRKEGISYWKDEPLVCPSKFKQCDVLVMHTGPKWIGPTDKGQVFQDYVNDDFELADACNTERELANEIIKNCKPKKFYCGHFHVSEFKTEMGCDARILDINEIVEHRP